MKADLGGSNWEGATNHPTAHLDTPRYHMVSHDS